MARHHSVLLKVVRFTGWPLFVLVVIYILTGYIMRGEYGMDRLLDQQKALSIHHLFHNVLIVLLLTHALPAMYLAFWRRGWIGRRKT